MNFFRKHSLCSLREKFFFGLVDSNFFDVAENNEDVKIGLKIILTLRIINPNLFENLSEINLRNGKDIYHLLY